MAYPIEIKQQAISLRKSGYSIREISHLLNIAQSSSSLWVRNTTISPSGLKRMVKRKEIKRYKMSQAWIRKRLNQDLIYKNLASKTINEASLSPANFKLLCSMLFWAEGSKDVNHIGFTNSDPKMISCFLTLLRKSFIIDERKLHVSVHLHEYHNTQETLNFWSKITKIPLTQFIKPYLKPHTSIRKKDSYRGCITVRYYDYKIARELTAIYNALGEKL